MTDVMRVKGRTILGCKGPAAVAELLVKTGDRMETRLSSLPWVHTNYLMIRLLLFGAALLILSSLYVTVPLLPVFVDQFHIGAGKAALAGTAFSLFFAMGCLVYDPLSSRVGRKRTMIIGLAVLTVATACVGYATSFELLVLLRALQGAAAATFSPVALTYAGEVFPLEQRVTAIGFISSGFLMAGIFGQVWASSLASLVGWTWVFKGLAMLYLLVLLLLALWLPSSPVQAGLARQRQRGGTLRWYGVLLRRELLLCYGITFTILLCFVGMYSVLGSLLGQAPYLLGDMDILGIRSLGMIGMLLSFYAGWMCRKWGKLRVLRVGLAGSLGALVAMSLVQQLGLYVVMSVLFVAGIAVVVPALISLIGELGNENRGVATSIYTFVLFAGASIGPILAASLLGSGQTALPLLVFAGIIMVALACSLWVRLSEEREEGLSQAVK